MSILEHLQVDLVGKNVTIIGAGTGRQTPRRHDDKRARR